MEIRLSASDYDLLSSHAAKCFPEEACALLVGEKSGKYSARVSSVVLSKNIAEDPFRYFEVDPAKRIAVEKEIRKTDQCLLGVFHTHPEGNARPSKTDERMIYEPSLIWLIASSCKEGIENLNAFEPEAEGQGFRPIMLRVA
ncbi:M67 family metallopeptidase [Sneathiella aquimaris]|uniref:M67 family metallopeptidase n=1 Tax=Sneathiella aquimaris TaxID=2599305 RepID=UPI00146E9BA2|nr:M67 family metallopeptidase [Sneathiella aquimaris]